MVLEIDGLGCACLVHDVHAGTGAGSPVGQGRAGQGRAGQGRAGQGRAGQGRAGQGRAGQGRSHMVSSASASGDGEWGQT